MESTPEATGMPNPSKLLDDAQAILDGAIAEERDLTAQELARVDALLSAAQAFVTLASLDAAA